MNRFITFLTLLCLAASASQAQAVRDLPACPVPPGIDLSPMSFVIGDANGDGHVTGDDIPVIASLTVGKEVLTFDMDGADANLDGKVNISDAIAVIDYLVERAVELSRLAHSASYAVGSGMPASAKASRRSTQVPQRPQ